MNKQLEYIILIAIGKAYLLSLLYLLIPYEVRNPIISYVWILLLNSMHLSNTIYFSIVVNVDF